MYRVFGSFARRLIKVRALSPVSSDVSAAETATAVASNPPIARASPAGHPEPADEHVQQWKGTWVDGAESRWAGTTVLANPYKAGSTRAAAWRAGWHWADRQPDRREPANVRFAHGHRRRTDGSSLLVRRTHAGAVGLSVLAVAGWMWEIRRQRRAAEKKARELKP
jgi:hypothetical protein